MRTDDRVKGGQTFGPEHAPGPEVPSSFDLLILPHLDSAYNLARWLLRDTWAAEDATQEAMLRALRYFASFRGGDARPWLLAIVRNVCHLWIERRAFDLSLASIDVGEETPGASPLDAYPDPQASDPIDSLLRKQERERVDRAIRALPVAFREVIVLRELEELSYQQIADVVGIPIGTVMSRLSRAKGQLKVVLDDRSARIGSAVAEGRDPEQPHSAPVLRQRIGS